MYLDPGFGQMIIQVIVAAVAAGGAYVLLFKDKLKGLFKRGKKGAQAEEVHSEESEAKE